MSPEEWEKVSELFQAARAKPRGEQIALLDSVCGDSSLRQIIEQMLRDDEASSSFLNQPLLRSFAAGVSSDSRTVFSTGVVPGVRFGRYEIVAPIGRGGMGEVWKGRDLELDRPVALKFLSRDAALARAMERLTHEARAASALNHPNIITIHEVIRHNENSIIVMELVEGSTLRAICGIPQSLDRVVNLGSQAAKALAAAHSNGIVHRDIKPENILVRQDGYVKVLDFGLARRLGGTETGSSSLFSGGTLRYMSPEQARGESISPASDVFSLGLVLYELSTGRHAFPSDSPFGAVCAMLTSEPAVPSTVNPRIPASLDSLILKTLAKSPDKRPSSQEVVRRLEELEMQAKALRPWLLSSTWKWASAVCLIVAFIAIWLLSRPGDSPQFANLRIEPLTSQDGWEGGPAISPDGESVAFVWTPSLETPQQIYVKRDRESGPIRLTDERTDGIVGPPVWSADGKSIAFKRQSKSFTGVFVTPSAGGGPEKKLVDLSVTNLAPAIDWSPDGRELAFSDIDSGSRRLGIYLFNLQTGKRRQLTFPASLEYADWDAKFSPDGRTIAFKRVHGFWDDAIYTVPVSGGEVRRATSQGAGIWGHAWSRNGKSLILSCQRGTSIFGLWRFPLDRRNLPERIIQGASDAITPAISPKTGRLVWANLTEDSNIYRVATTGGQPQRLIASNARDHDATYSPDGRIAFISDRSGTREIWLARADGSDQRRVTSFNGPDMDNLEWSPDGRHLAFYAGRHGHANIFTMDCEPAKRNCGDPKLTVSGMKAAVPEWPRDGNFLYFASDRIKRWEVWKKPLSGGEPIQITRNGGFMPRESQDGKWLYFLNVEKLWRIRLPLDQSKPSKEELVIGSPFFLQLTGWALTADEIFFMHGAAKGQPGSLRAYRISTGRTRLILPSLPIFADSRDYSLSVSPDSKWILYSQLDRSGSNIMVAESH